MARALHIGIDDKWVDPAVRNLSQAGLRVGDVIIVSGERKLRHVSTATSQGLPYRVLGSRSLAAKVLRESYDVVVLHSLPGPKSSANPILRLISRLPSGIPVVWIGWGYDYYNDLIFQDTSEFAGLLPRTREALEEAQHQRAREALEEAHHRNSHHRILRRGLMGLLHPMGAFHYLFGWRPTPTSPSAFPHFDVELLNRINIFSPRLRSEFDLVKSNSPDFVARFRTFDILSDDLHAPLYSALLQEPASERGSGEPSVIVGNSASAVINHLDAVHDLLSQGSRIRQVAIPSSYGDQDYLNLLKSRLAGQGQCEITFRDEYVPPMQYAEWMRNFSAFAHAGLRQHALWNIYLMLAGRGRVILRPENPLFNELTAAGFPVNNFSDLETNPEIIGSRFDIGETQRLESAMDKTLDRSLTLDTNREFVEYALASTS